MDAGNSKVAIRSIWIIRSSNRAGVLIFTLMIAVMLMIVGLAFLMAVERDNRFSGIQERSERAWYLAESGLEYYRLYGCGTHIFSSSDEHFDQPQGFLRLYVPADNSGQYFEFADMGRGDMLVRGVVEDSLSNSTATALRVERQIVVPSQNLEDAYDPTIALERLDGT